jgi:hypothetical protein
LALVQVLVSSDGKMGSLGSKYPNHASSTAPEEKWFARTPHILKSALANLYYRSVEGFAGLLITFKKA